MTSTTMDGVTADGSLTVSLASAEVSLRASGAMWLARERMLVVADLHLEKGSAYALRGQLLPPYDTAETLNRLAREVAALRPETVVLLGDTLHDGDAQTRIGPIERERLADLSKLLRLVWVRGNHDPEGAGDLGGETVESVEVSGLILRHDPTEGAGPGEVAGHLHPCIKIHGPAGAIRRRCFASDGQRMILPAFGAYAGGLNLKDVAFAGLFERKPTGFALGRRVTPISFGRLSPDR